VTANRIADYGMIGDCHSLALVGVDGSIDWACFPRFDSPSVFARMLDERRGGHFSVRPVRGAGGVRRRYLDDTNVLVTTFTTDDGVIELTDCMPVEPLDPRDPTAVRSHHAILRRVRCTEGAVDVRIELQPRFEYGLVAPRLTATSPTTAEIVGGSSALWTRSTHTLEEEAGAIGGRWRLTAGDEAWTEVAWSSAHDPIPVETDVPYEVDLPYRLDQTIDYWRSWTSRCRYEGDCEDAVHRSALVLKALTYAPTGAVVAAGTTSLPEWIGGARNWDYRFTWIRDATLTLTSLFILGYDAEAAAFKRWLERTGAGRPEDLQIMYGVGGERMLPELELDHLAGHRGSRPVLIGNAAVKQQQLDAYGQILDAAYLYGKAGGELTQSNWVFLAGLADVVARDWRRPDHGIWEMRDRPRHFVHSKLNCWVALDRAVRIAEAASLPGDVATWRRERENVRAYLFEEGAPHGWFRQAAGVDAADASTLLAAALGFLPARHPVMRETLEVVQRDLTTDGLVHRYLSPDGLEGHEGAFLLCSFWLLDCLTHAGRIDEAEKMLGRLLALANDVGLFAEEVDTVTGELLGNTPQAFAHMALVASCADLAAARRGQLPDDDEANAYAELAVDRLVASRGELLNE
jgi:GH15 family glucan-1,4-alpha-glucosidase